MGIRLDGRRVEIPMEQHMHAGFKQDFRLPIDEADCCCKFDRKTQFMEVYVNGQLLPDVDNTQKPLLTASQIIPAVIVILAILFALAVD